MTWEQQYSSLNEHLDFTTRKSTCELIFFFFWIVVIMRLLRTFEKSLLSERDTCDSALGLINNSKGFFYSVSSSLLDWLGGPAETSLLFVVWRKGGLLIA